MPTAAVNAAVVTLSVAINGGKMKKKNVKGATRKLSVSAMLCALGVIILALGSVISALDLTMVAITSIFVFFAVLEMGNPYPYLIYAVTAILSLILLPDKFTAFLYFIFGGIYPILKRFMERCPRLISWIFKLVYFNTVIASMVLGSKYLFGIDDEGMTIGLFALGNAALIMYDIAISKLLTLYQFRLRKRLRIEKYFNK